MLIGFCGYAQAGKDTAARPLVNRGFTRLAFADALKEGVAQALGVSLKYLQSHKSELREALVAVGRAGRAIDPNKWVAPVEDVMGKFDDVVITDVRYCNEVSMILRHGGRVFLIERPGLGPANKEEAVSINDIMYQFQLPIFQNYGSKEDLWNSVLVKLFYETP